MTPFDSPGFRDLMPSAFYAGLEHETSDTIDPRVLMCTDGSLLTSNAITQLTAMDDFEWSVPVDLFSKKKPSAAQRIPSTETSLPSSNWEASSTTATHDEQNECQDETDPSGVV